MENTLPTSIDSYDDAVQWIYGRINYERVRPQKLSTHFRLERVEKLLSVIGSPQQRIPAVHIAGTKGKGSTAAILNSILVSSGIRTGLFTSPHIELFEERLCVNGAMPNQSQLTELVTELQDRLSHADPDIVADGPTYFEVATLLAWMFFDQQKVEIAVLETGLGGRLDCTNVCSPLLTIITSIGLDHTDILGDTLPLITAEKAGILKQNVPLLTWVHQPEVIEVIRNRAAQLSCDVYWRDSHIQVATHQSNGLADQCISVTTPQTVHPNLHLPLLGRHQAGNAALAVAAADVLSRQERRITAQTIATGVSQTHWPLRFEHFGNNPTIILDAAHNPDSVAAFVETCQEQFGDRPATLIFASSRDKDAATMLKIVAPRFQQIVLTKFERNPRAIGTEQLTVMLQDAITVGHFPAPEIHVAETPTESLQVARRIVAHDGVICCAGSIFIAAELRTLLAES
jgi:dihydrofolate synthase / folylpolyglutamate synthase